MENFNIPNQTGSFSFSERFKFITLDLGKYSIKIKLTEDNKFVAISEISERKDFMTSEQKLSTKGYHDVNEFYEDVK